MRSSFLCVKTKNNPYRIKEKRLCSFIQNILSFNQILTVSLLGWLVAQVLKTIINFILLGKFQLERMWGDGGMPSAHSATVCAMVIATGRCVGVDSAIFAVASVVAIITMHDAMGVRHETGEQAKVLNQMIEEWIDISEKNAAPFLQNMHLKEMVGHTPLQVVAGVLWSAQPSASCIRWLEAFFFFTQERTAATENLNLKDV